jgi:hypothetical protein
VRDLLWGESMERKSFYYKLDETNEQTCQLRRSGRQKQSTKKGESHSRVVNAGESGPSIVYAKIVEQKPKSIP